MLEAIRMVLDNAPELQGTELAAHVQSGQVEHHYHPPGYVGGPTGWHKGVTVYEQKS